MITPSPSDDPITARREAAMNLVRIHSEKIKKNHVCKIPQRMPENMGVPHAKYFKKFVTIPLRVLEFSADK
jgi:hypothetical protein